MDPAFRLHDGQLHHQCLIPGSRATGGRVPGLQQSGQLCGGPAAGQRQHLRERAGLRPDRARSWPDRNGDAVCQPSLPRRLPPHRQRLGADRAGTGPSAWHPVLQEQRRLPRRQRGPRKQSKHDLRRRRRVRGQWASLRDNVQRPERASGLRRAGAGRQLQPQHHDRGRRPRRHDDRRRGRHAAAPGHRVAARCRGGGADRSGTWASIRWPGCMSPLSAATPTAPG